MKPVLIAIVVFLTGIACGVASAQVRQTHLQIALGDLQAARYHISASPIDMAGHRGSALSMLDGAIEQVRLEMDAPR
jgi:hypothetical protein